MYSVGTSLGVSFVKFGHSNTTLQPGSSSLSCITPAPQVSFAYDNTSAGVLVRALGCKEKLCHL